MGTKKNTSEIKFRTTIEEKNEIRLRAEKAGTSVSAFVRTCSLDDKKIVFLDKGQVIAEKLCEVYNHLDYCIKHNKFNDDEATELMKRLEDISQQLYLLTQSLTVIDSEDEQEGE